MITPKDIVMGKEQIDEIFSVNINSGKLIGILKRLEENYQKMESKVAKIDQYCRDSTSVLNTKIINSQQVFKDMIDSKINQATLISQKRILSQTQSFASDLSSKIAKLSEVQKTIRSIEQVINHANDNVTNEIQNEISHFSSQVVSLRKYVENLSSEINKKIESFRVEMNCNKENFLEIQDKYRVLRDQMNSSMNADFASENGRKFEDTPNPKRFSEFAHSEVSENDKQFKRNQKPKSKTKKYEVTFNGTPQHSVSKSINSQSNRLNQDYFTAISAKVDNLQKVVQQQTQKFQIQTLRQTALKRKPKNSITKTVSYTKQEFEILSNGQKSAQDNIDNITEQEMLGNILKRLSGIGSLMQSKQKKLKKTIDEVKQKFLMFEQKHEFNKQRILKVASQLQQFKVKFTKQLQKKSQTTIDQTRLSTLQTQIGRIIQRLDHDMHAKNVVQIEEYNADKNKTMQKFKIIHEILVYKAEKDDVKKAIGFLEEKIKQIILVMAHEFNEEKLGAINKQSVKCLTCDKQIFKQQTVNNQMARTSAKGFNQRKGSMQSSRTHLSRLLSPKKLLNQSSSMRRDRLNYTTVLTQTQQDKNEILPFEC